jgi:hypothetical protein
MDRLPGRSDGKFSRNSLQVTPGPWLNLRFWQEKRKGGHAGEGIIWLSDVGEVQIGIARLR